MGNPHAVIFVPFLDAVDLNTLGPKFETHPAFPKKTNTEFVQVRKGVKGWGGWVGQGPVGLIDLSMENRRVAPPCLCTCSHHTHIHQVISPSLLRMKVWERGAGPTLACGTGACALTVAAILSGKTDQRYVHVHVHVHVYGCTYTHMGLTHPPWTPTTSEVTVQLPGGDLQIEWRAADDHIYMTGAAELVYGGTFGAVQGAK